MEASRYFTVLAMLTCVTIKIYVGASLCKSNQNHAGFDISCSKSDALFREGENNLEISINCRRNENPSWDNFPKNLFNFHEVNKTVFTNCNFPQNLSLFEKTQSLGLKRVHVLSFRDSQTMLSKENLRNFSLSQLTFENIIFSELPRDLIHELSTKYLLIDGRSLRSIPQDFFANAKDLTHLDIYHTKLSKLKKSDFQGLGSLQQLLLFKNDIDEIELGTFDEMPNLRKLDLSKNRLRVLPDGIFRSLTSLTHISLSENSFSSLPENLFQSSLGLNFVKLNWNEGGLSELPKGFFKGLTQLSEVELKCNNFSRIPEGLFADSYALRILDISKNRLTEIPSNLLESASFLRELYISDNALKDLPDFVFAHSKLEKLHIHNNQLSSLPEKALEGLKDLTELEISYNRLSSIHPHFCEFVPNVSYVNISHNELASETIMESVFLNCINLMVADLSHNKIAALALFWATKLRLVHLNLEGNEISEVDETTFKILHMNMILNLRDNNISKVNLAQLSEIAQAHKERLPSIEKNATIYLERNPLNCDCLMLPLVQYVKGRFNKIVYPFVKISVDGLKCASPTELEEKPIQEVADDDLRCLTTSRIPTDACSATCKCWIYPSKTVPLIVDCSNRGLTEVPRLIHNPHNFSIYLNLSGNHLMKTPTGLNVTALDLSSNNISVVSKLVFSETLRELKLHNNSISSLDPDIVQYLDDYGSQHHPYNLTVTLYDNKWFCDCDMREFLNVYQLNLKPHQWPHKVYCQNMNRTLDDLTGEELCGYLLEGLVTFLILLAVFMFGLTVFVTVYFKNQEKIKIWLYSKKFCLWWVTEEELDKDKVYDAFISFSHLDEDFVETELKATLEEGPCPYKLCLHHRDWLVGEWVPTQIANSVEESRRTIVVLSPNFIESIWGRLEFKTAHNQALSEGRVRLIVILYGDINVQELDPELKGYLSMNTYLKWGDPWFWDKLRYALPHRSERRRKIPRNARLIENHLAQIPLNNHDSGSKSDAIPLPKISNACSNDSAKLLDPTSEEVRA